MGWVSDNAVWLAFLVAAVAVVLAIAFAALRGWLLYKAARREAGKVTALTSQLSASAAALQSRVADLQARQGEIQGSVARTQRYAAGVAVMASHAASARRTLLAPLKYIGR